MNAKLQGIQGDILRLSVPAVVSNITIPLLGLCDTAISGHLGAAGYLGAIAVGAMMLNVTFWLFGFLRMGTSGLAANAFGAGDSAEQMRVLARAVLAGFSIGLFIILVQRPLESLLMAAIAPTEDVRSLATRYFRVCIWGSPALLSTMAVSGWFVGMQSTSWPMAVAILTNVVNIVLSLTFSFGMGLGFSGVAYGTLASNWLGLVLSVVAVAVFMKGRMAFPSLRDVLRGREMMRFFTVNRDLFFRSACIMAISLAVTRVSAGYGAVLLGANAVMMQFFHMFSFFMDGYAFTAEALVGRYCGSRDRGMLSLSVWSLLVWTLSLTAAFTLLYGLGWRPIARLLTDVGDVVEALGPLSVFIILIPVVSSWAFLLDGFYVGVTKTGRMLFATALSAVVFFGTAFVDIHDGGLVITSPELSRLWIAFLSYLLVRGVALGLLWPDTLRRIFDEPKK